MSQKIPSEGGQKGFAVGRGLLAAAETLNFSMNEQRSDNLYGSSSRPSYSLSSGAVSGDSKEPEPQLDLRSGEVGHLSSTLKLFSSLGLSPADLDMLAQVPEEDISVETLPHLIMQLKKRKAEAARRAGANARDLPPLSPEQSYGGPREDWEYARGNRMSGSAGLSLGRDQRGDCGSYSSMREGSSHSYDPLDYSDGASGSRDRQYSELSGDRYSGFSMGSSSASDSVFISHRGGSPSPGKVQDFLGVMPQMFPHVCSICDFDIHSSMEWTQHTNGVWHAENSRHLLQLFPEWRPHEASNRVSASILLETTNRSDGLLGPAPMTTALQRGGMNSNWGPRPGQSQGLLNTPKMQSRVVVAKYEMRPYSVDSLLSLAQPFGTVCDHLILRSKGFIEMHNHEEAVAMVEFYQRKPARLHGKPIIFYISRDLMFIERGNRAEKETRVGKGQPSQVIFFSNLPREREKKAELLVKARRFGTVQKYLFLNEQAFVQMSSPEDAETMVKYYTLRPLTIKGRTVRLNICTKYRTLTVNQNRYASGNMVEDRKSSSTTSKSTLKGQKSPTSSDRASKEQEAAPGKDEELEGVEVEDGSGDEIAGVVEEEDNMQLDKLLEPELPEPATSEAEEPQTEPLEPTDRPEAVFATEIVKEASEVAHGVKAESQNIEAGAVSHKEPVKEAEPKPVNVNAAEPSGEQESLTEQDFPDNMEDFVTLDEVAEEEEAHPASISGESSAGKTNKNGGMRVVNVAGFKRGYNFLTEILALAKPFGTVVRHLVLNVRPEAFVELSSEQEAKSMVSFYNGNVTPMVCGKPVKIFHSQTYATIQGGRVVYLGQLPTCKYSDASLLKIAEPFGKVRRYFLNHLRNECFIEMEGGDDAEKMANAYKENPPKFCGKRLSVYVSRKYKQLKHGHRPPAPESEEEWPAKRKRPEETPSTASAKTKPQDEEPQAKKICVVERSTPQKESVSTGEEGVEKTACEQKEEEPTVIYKLEKSSSNLPPECPEVSNDLEPKVPELTVTPPNEQNENEEPVSAKPQEQEESSDVSLRPYQPDTPVGVEYVKMGYYCRVCFLFYSSEDRAKKVHCSSQSHYDKLKKFLEKKKTTQ